MTPRRPSSRSQPWLLALLLLASGCGSMHFSYHAVRASRHVEQARQMDAERLAPYEFELATLYLDKAREEAGKAEYQDAVAFARVANEQAVAAVQSSRRARGERAAAKRAAEAGGEGSEP